MKTRAALASLISLFLVLSPVAAVPVLAAPLAQDPVGNQSVFLPIVSHPCGSAAVAIVVDGQLLNGFADPSFSLRSSLDQWYADLCNAGYTPLERVSTTSDPLEVRATLAELYKGYPLEGAILVGNIPYAWQVVTWPAVDGVPATDYYSPTYEIYNDLDGEFSRTPDFKGDPKGMYNRHTGATDWEIWVGTLPAYQSHTTPAMTIENTVAAIKRYLVKNHAYRTGQYSLGKDFLSFEENYGDVNDMYLPNYLKWLTIGTGSWMPFSNSSTARIYMRVNDPAMAIKLGYDSNTYKKDLSAGLADFFVHYGHGAYLGMGDLSVDYVRSHPINTAWYMAGGCDVGSPEYDNILTEMIYNPTSQVILAHGDMGPGGNLVIFNVGEKYGDHIASALAAKKPFGRAMLEFANGPRDPNQFQMPLFQSISAYGDPTLTLVRK